MSKKKLSKLLALYLPYVVIGLVATNLGEAWRLAAGKELGDKIVSLMDTLPAAFSNPLPSLHLFDLFIGLCCGAGMDAKKNALRAEDIAKGVFIPVSNMPKLEPKIAPQKGA